MHDPLFHYGVKGMRWGKRKSLAELVRDAKLHENGARQNTGAFKPVPHKNGLASSSRVSTTSPTTANISAEDQAKLKAQSDRIAKAEAEYLGKSKKKSGGSGGGKGKGKAKAEGKAADPTQKEASSDTADATNKRVETAMAKTVKSITPANISWGQRRAKLSKLLFGKGLTIAELIELENERRTRGTQ